MVRVVVAARTNRGSARLPIIVSHGLIGYSLGGDGRRPLCHQTLLGDIFYVFGGIIMMLIIAIPTVIKFATASHQNSFFVQDILKSNRNVATSRTVLSDAARTPLISHVTGLNVPQLKIG